MNAIFYYIGKNTGLFPHGGAWEEAWALQVVSAGEDGKPLFYLMLICSLQQSC
jgi:hypothetical protein